jgi:PAS domain S-box-containing protein
VHPAAPRRVWTFPLTIRRPVVAGLASLVLAVASDRKPPGEDPALYQAMFDQARDSRFVLDPDATILHSNPAAARLFGASEVTLRGVPFAELLAPGARAAFKAAWEVTQSYPSHAGPIPLMGRFSDGSMFPIEIDVVHGTADRWGVVARDARPSGRGPTPPGKFNPGQMLIASRIQELV